MNPQVRFLDVQAMTIKYIIIFYYQQPGDAKSPYLAQYSAVIEDSPVIKLCTVIKNNTAIKKILKPVKTNFNIFFIKIILLVALDNMMELTICSSI